MSNIYVSKIIADRCLEPIRKKYICNSIVKTNFNAAFTWLKEQRNYYQKALDFLKERFKENNYTWDYYNYLAFYRKELELKDLNYFNNYFQDIEIGVFTELNKIEFQIVKITLDKEYNCQKRIIKDLNFGEIVAYLDDINPDYDKN